MIMNDATFHLFSFYFVISLKFYMRDILPILISATEPLEDAKLPTEPPKVETEAEKLPTEPPKVETEAAKLPTEPPKVETEAAKLPTEPPKVETEAAKLPTEPPKVETEPAKLPTEPARDDCYITMSADSSVKPVLA